MAAQLAGERVRAVRHLLGISQIDLADAASVSQSLISQVENGVKEASEELLMAISEATATPRSFFDIMPPDVPMGTLRFRKLATARQGDTKRIKVLFDEAYRVITELMNEANYPRPDLPQITYEPSVDDLEKLASETRAALQLTDDGPIRHVTRACERAGVAVVPLTLPSIDDNEEGTVGHFGVSCWLSKDDPAVVGYFTGASGDRQRFTIAHEIGHLVLHSRRRSVRDPEGEANYFAAAMLIPLHRAEEMFANDITLSDLQHMKAHWGVSIQALIMRGANLGFIDERRKTSLFKQLSSRGWRKNEPVTVHAEEPMLAWMLISRKFGSRATYSKIAEEIGMSALVLRSLAPKPDASRSA
jgi:Zn-dependent peptidase ImmA (M78 family)/transcriptional regulator with XRE-family HTH domain